MGLNFKVQFVNHDAAVRTLRTNDGQNSVLMTFGPGSYLMSGTIVYGVGERHVLVGRYSSLADGLTFNIGQNHNLHNITTYPFENLRCLKTGDHQNHAAAVTRGQIIIGSDVWIGDNVCLMGGVRIGNGAVIGANTVVAKDIPPYAVAVGNPARIIKYRFDEETIRRLQKIKWWNWSAEKIEAHRAFLEGGDMEGFLAACERAYTPPSADEAADIAATVRTLRAEQYTIYYFIPDFSADDAVWRYAVESYITSYRARDKAALILAVSREEEAKEPLAAIAARLAACGDDTPLIFTHTPAQGREFSPAILQASDVLITTKEDVSSRAVDDAADAGLAIRYGLDSAALIFPPLS